LEGRGTGTDSKYTAWQPSSSIIGTNHTSLEFSPGARFDSESWSYGFSWSQEILDEWSWTEHFAPQPETERYLNFICDKFGLREDIQFKTRVKSAHWLDEIGGWKLTDESGKTYTSRFLITGIGVLSNPTLPNVPGVEDFKGEACHTARWPKEPVSFEGKRVGIIGTGATGRSQNMFIITNVAGLTQILQLFKQSRRSQRPLVT
jgi:cation diffusion facilitator CzcD-associated flavoprotein CzcO